MIVLPLRYAPRVPSGCKHWRALALAMLGWPTMRPNVRGVASVRLASSLRVRSGSPPYRPPPCPSSARSVRVAGHPPSSPGGCAAHFPPPQLVSVSSWGARSVASVARRRLACRLVRHLAPFPRIGGAPLPPAPTLRSPLLPRSYRRALSHALRRTKTLRVFLDTIQNPRFSPRL